MVYHTVHTGQFFRRVCRLEAYRDANGNIAPNGSPRGSYASAPAPNGNYRDANGNLVANTGYQRDMNGSAAVPAGYYRDASGNIVPNGQR